MLRPLPGKRAESRSALSTLDHGGLNTLSSRRDTASEDLAQILAQRNLLETAVWLRLEALDGEPGCLMESLLRAADHTAGSPVGMLSPWTAQSGVRTHAEVGKYLAQYIDRPSVVILEDEHPNRATTNVLEMLAEYCRHAGAGASAVYVGHGPLRRRNVALPDDAMDKAGSRDADLRKVLAEGDPDLSDLMLDRLISLAAHRHALLNDILDAAAERDPGLITYLIGGLNPHRSLEHRINARLLPRVSAAELQALSIACQTGYWHLSLSDRAPPRGISLRPWMLPLEEGWWWLRPLWRRSLHKLLSDSQRAGRRFFKDYHRAHAETLAQVPPPNRPMRASQLIDTDAKVVTPAAKTRTKRPPSQDQTANTIALTTEDRRAQEEPSGRPQRPAVPATDVLDVLLELREETREIRAQLEALQPPSSINTADPPPESTVIEVCVLGNFSVSVGDQLIEWTGRRARNLFQFLIQHHPQPVHREALMETFWPGADPAASRNCLNVAVHDLRKHFRDTILSGKVVVYDGGAYRIDPQIDIRIDATEFTRGVELLLNGRWDLDPELLDELASVVGVYQGDYLALEHDQEWANTRRRYLRRLYVSALDVIARASFDAEDFEVCINACRRITEVEQAHEVAHRRMITALARTGRMSEALDQFDVCAGFLADRLGVRPSEQTLQLVRDVRAGYFS